MFWLFSFKVATKQHGEKTNTDQLVCTFGQNICQIFHFNNIVFLYTKFTYNTCYFCSERN